MVMITAAISAIIALSIASVISNMQLAENNVKFRTDGDSLNEEIRALLSSQVSCTSTFAGQTTANHTLTSIYDGIIGAPPRYKTAIQESPAPIYGDRSIIISAISLSNFLPGVSPDTGQMTLTFTFLPAKKSTGVQQILRSINLNVNLSPSTNVISSCIALAKMSDGIWQRSPSNQNNIFFASPNLAGNVGINAQDPQVRLHVNGEGLFQTFTGQSNNIRTALTVSQASSIDITPGFGVGVSFQIQDDTTPNQEIGTITAIRESADNSGSLIFNTKLNGVTSGHLQITAAGDVGIGTTAMPSAKLEVNGTLKIGTTTALCTTLNEGHMRYNSTSKNVEFCDGMSWKAFSSLPPPP